MRVYFRRSFLIMRKFITRKYFPTGYVTLGYDRKTENIHIQPSEEDDEFAYKITTDDSKPSDYLLMRPLEAEFPELEYAQKGDYPVKWFKTYGTLGFRPKFGEFKRNEKKNDSETSNGEQGVDGAKSNQEENDDESIIGGSMSGIIELFCELLTETSEGIDDEGAILVKYEGEEVWLPKSQITFEPTSDLGFVTVYIPEWLAIEKELV